jgi:tetratricopeptide (TPR) repeat protein
LDPEKRDYKDAVAIAQKKARNDDSNDPRKAELKAMAEEAAQAYSRGEYLSAMDLYKQLDEKEPNQAKVKGNIGTIYLALKNQVMALEYFQQARKLKPDEPSYRQTCEQLEANLKHVEEARMASERAWQNPGKTTINLVPNNNGGGNNTGDGGDNINDNGNRTNAKMPPLATSYGLLLKHKGDGVEITTVGIGSRAARCGLLKGDLIKAVDGVVVESPDQLNQIFASRPNVQFQLLIQRGNKIGQIVF